MCLEADLPDLRVTVADPWTDPPELLAANPTGRVPTLVLPETGQVIVESILIAEFASQAPSAPTKLWFCNRHERHVAGLALGAIDAAAAVIAGRMALSGEPADPEFDQTSIGIRRHDAIARSLLAMDQLLGCQGLSRPSFAAFLPAIAIDYLALRFGSRHCETPLPHLGNLVNDMSPRASMRRTRPLANQSSFPRPATHHS